MREMRKAHTQLPDAQAWACLEQAPYITLAFMGTQGYPCAMPVNSVILEEAIYLHTGLRGEKADAIGRGARVCVNAVIKCAPDGEATGTYHSVMAYGMAHPVEGPEKRRALEALALHYGQSEKVEDPAYISGAIDHLLVLRIDVEEIRARRVEVK